MTDALDQRMGGQELREAAAESARAMTVDDAHARLAGERGLVEEFVDALRSLLDRAADHVDLLRRSLVARLRVNSDSGRAARCRLRFRWFRVAGDCGDVRKRHFHAQRSGFDFSRTAIVAAENHRLLESLDVDARTL